MGAHDVFLMSAAHSAFASMYVASAALAIGTTATRRTVRAAPRSGAALRDACRWQGIIVQARKHEERAGEHSSSS
eukprot:365390-Chlamydomonas_euryale.AAC.28